MGDLQTWGYGIIGGETTGLNLSDGCHGVIRANYFHDNVLGELRRLGCGIVHETWGEQAGREHRRPGVRYGTVYEHNIFENCAFALLFSGRDHVHGHTIRYNVFSKSYQQAIHFRGDNEGHFVANNVFAGNREGAVVFQGGGQSRYIKDNPPVYYPTGNTVRDNLIIGKGIVADRGATLEDNVVTANRELPERDVTLSELMARAREMGGDYSRVPGVAATP